MTMLNKSDWCGIQCSAISKWPVEETGRNSVIPSIIPNRMTAITIGIRRLDGKALTKTSQKVRAMDLISLWVRDRPGCKPGRDSSLHPHAFQIYCVHSRKGERLLVQVGLPSSQFDYAAGLSLA